MRGPLARRSLLICLSALLGSFSSAAVILAQETGRRLKGVVTPGEHPVTAALIAEHTSVPPDGHTRIGVLFEMGKGWHIYAEEPGDAGLPTKVTWNAPPAVSFGPLTWPKAQQFLDPGDIKTFGYSGAVTLYSKIAFVPLINPNDKYPDLPIHADVEWLACKDLCVPGKAHLELTLPVSSKPQALSTYAQLFQQTD